MESVKIFPNPNRLEILPQIPVHLFPNNFALHLENASIYTKHLHAAYVLIDEDQYQGSIALYHHPQHKIQGEDVLSIGYFHCVKDASVSALLFDIAKEEGIILNCKHVIGPINGSTWENYRLRITDTPSPFILESQTPVYYNDLFTSYGFTPIKKYFSYISSIEDYIETAQKSDSDPKEFGLLSIRSIAPDQYENELRQFHDLAHKSFGQNFLFTPYSWEDFIKKYSLLQNISDPTLSFVAEFENTIVGFAFVLEDLLCTKKKRAVLKTLAVHPEYQSLGIGNMLTLHAMNVLHEKKFDSCIIAYIVEDSLSNSIFKKKARFFREYRLYHLTI